MIWSLYDTPEAEAPEVSEADKNDDKKTEVWTPWPVVPRIFHDGSFIQLQFPISSKTKLECDAHGFTPHGRFTHASSTE